MLKNENKCVNMNRNTVWKRVTAQIRQPFRADPAPAAAKKGVQTEDIDKGAEDCSRWLLSSEVLGTHVSGPETMLS